VLGGLAARFGQSGIDPSRGGGIAAQTLMQNLTTQALTLAFDDVFRLTAWIFVACLLLVPFCLGGPMSQRVRGHHH
jgi:MFS transporter, DHA2 family, multidrug resistance protein